MIATGSPDGDGGTQLVTGVFIMISTMITTIVVTILLVILMITIIAIM
jgi:hypothetical protein